MALCAPPLPAAWLPRRMRGVVGREAKGKGGGGGKRTRPSISTSRRPTFSRALRMTRADAPAPPCSTGTRTKSAIRTSTPCTAPLYHPQQAHTPRSRSSREQNPNKVVQKCASPPLPCPTPPPLLPIPLTAPTRPTLPPNSGGVYVAVRTPPHDILAAPQPRLRPAQLADYRRRALQRGLSVLSIQIHIQIQDMEVPRRKMGFTAAAEAGRRSCRASSSILLHAASSAGMVFFEVFVQSVLENCTISLGPECGVNSARRQGVLRIVLACTAILDDLWAAEWN